MGNKVILGESSDQTNHNLPLKNRKDITLFFSLFDSFGDSLYSLWRVQMQTAYVTQNQTRLRIADWVSNFALLGTKAQFSFVPFLSVCILFNLSLSLSPNLKTNTHNFPATSNIQVNPKNTKKKLFFFFAFVF